MADWFSDFQPTCDIQTGSEPAQIRKIEKRRFPGPLGPARPKINRKQLTDRQKQWSNHACASTSNQRLT